MNKRQTNELIATLATLTAALSRVATKRYITIHSAVTGFKPFIDAHMPAFQKSVKKFFKRLQDEVTLGRVRASIDNGGVLDSELQLQIAAQYKAFYSTEYQGMIADLMREQGETMARRIRRAAGKSDSFFETKGFFNSATERILRYIRSRVAQYLAEPGRNKINDVRDILESGIKAGDSTYSIQQQIKAIMPLTHNETQWLQNFYENALTEGMSMDQALRQSIRYSDFLAKVRAERIARTEIHNAYVTANGEGVAQAMADGIIKGAKKTWHTAMDDRVRDSHERMEGVTVDYDQDYIDPETGENHGQHPTEINCRCVEEDSVEV